MYGKSDNISAFSAAEYDDKIGCVLPYYDEFYKQVIDVVQAYNFDAASWLDVGCGTGKMAQVAFSQAELDRFVFCDSSEKMIELAKSRFKDEKSDFIVCNVLNLPFKDEFDVVTAIQVNHYFNEEDRVTAIKKCYSALKSGGIFISFENFAPFSELGKKLCLNRWRTYQIKHGRSEAESEAHISRYNKAYFPISVTENLQMLKSCGFKSAEILWLSYMQAGFLGIK